MAGITPRTIASTAGTSVTIRSAQPKDAARLAAYVRRVAAETPFFLVEPDEFKFSDEQERRWIYDHLDGPGRLAIVAEAGQEMAGALNFENGHHRRTAHRGNLNVSVREHWRGQGIGSALLRTLIEWARANPLIEKIGLDVMATNEAAIRLYQKLGFVEEGRRLGDVKLGPGEYVDIVVMCQFVKERA